jgi:hypothetical protein
MTPDAEDAKDAMPHLVLYPYNSIVSVMWRKFAVPTNTFFHLII